MHLLDIHGCILSNKSLKLCMHLNFFLHLSKLSLTLSLNLYNMVMGDILDHLQNS